MDNVEEMDKFLEKYNFPKQNQEEIENLKRPITSMEIEPVNRFAAEFYQKFSEQLTLVLLKLFKKIAEEGKLPNSLEIFKISFLILTLGFFISSFSSCFRCRARLFI